MSDQNVTIVTKPWGREVIYASTELYIGKIIEINTGARLSLQYHEAKDETIYVLDGRLRLVIGDSAEALENARPGRGRQRAGAYRQGAPLRGAAWRRARAGSFYSAPRRRDAARG